MIGYPFDSQVTFDQQGNPQYDRAISSKPLKELIRKLFTTGVMPNPSTNLQVVEGVSGLTTIVKAGFCIIEGGLKLEEEDKTMMHQAADTTYDRIDTVVMRWNDNDNARICALYVLAGTPSATPVRPTLNREGSVYEIGLADVLIKANSTAISQQRITDTRYETERCGVISSISEFDTDTIYAQVQADLAGFKADEEADFLAWFDEMKDQLSEDAAGNLQNQIGILSNLETTNKNSLVGAINEVKNATPDDMTGATASTNGVHGLVPAPQAGDENKCLKGDGTWGTVDASTVRYVPSTDKVQLWDGSDWVNWKTAGLLTPIQLIPMMTGNTVPSGQASIVFENYGSYDYFTGYKNKSAVTSVNVRLATIQNYAYLGFINSETYPNNPSYIEFGGGDELGISGITGGFQYIFDDIYTIKYINVGMWQFYPTNNYTARGTYRIYTRDATTNTWTARYTLDVPSVASGTNSNNGYTNSGNINIDTANVNAIKVVIENVRCRAFYIGDIRAYGY